MNLRDLKLRVRALAVVFTFFNVFVFRVDAVPNPGEPFGVERPRSSGGERVRFTRPQYEALHRETNVFSDAFAMMPDIDSRIDGRMMAGTLVTGNSFQVLGVRAARRTRAGVRRHVRTIRFGHRTVV